MHDIIKSSGSERTVNNTRSNRYLTEQIMFKDDLTIFAQNANNFINIFTGDFAMGHNNHDTVIKFYEKKKGGK